MADIPSGDGTAESKNQLSNDSQGLHKTNHGSADEEGEERAEAGNDERLMSSSDNGAADVDCEARDGDDDWQELREDNRSSGDERLTVGLDCEAKGDGVGEENPSPLCISPLGSYDYEESAVLAAADFPSDHANNHFAPAQTINFDDYDDGDLSFVDQHLIPRGMFIRSDYLDDRPELHGSEGTLLLPNSAARRVIHSNGDHSQNVRIIEGHDDLDLDPRVGFVAMASRNNFLQTQVLHSLSAEDHNASANLYDSLEREEGDLYLEDEEEEDQLEEEVAECAGRDAVSGEDGSSMRETHSVFFDSRVPVAHSVQHQQMQTSDYAYDDQVQNMTSGGGEQAAGLTMYQDCSATSPSRDHPLHSDSRFSSPRLGQDQQALQHNSQHESAIAGQKLSRDDGGDPVGSTLLVSLPKPSQNFLSGSVSGSERGICMYLTRMDIHEPGGARPKQTVNTESQRGGPTGSTDGHTVCRPNTNGKFSCADTQTRLRSANDTGASGVAVGAARQASNNTTSLSTAPSRQASNNTTSLSTAPSRQASNNTTSLLTAPAQRPAVQGAAVMPSSLLGGDGDGAVANSAGASLGQRLQGQRGQGPSNRSTLTSKGSSQLSLHSAGSTNSTNRVSGVGKESSHRHYQGQGRAASNSTSNVARLGAGQVSDGNGAGRLGNSAHHPGPPLVRSSQPSTTAAPSQALPVSSLAAPTSAKQASVAGGQGEAGRKGGSRARDAHAAQLRQQHTQLVQEQQLLHHKQQQLQQQQGGAESSDGDNLVHHQPDAVLTQMGHLQQEAVFQEKAGAQNVQTEVRGMEELRGVLQGMLRMQREAAASDQRNFDFADCANTPLTHQADNSALSGFPAPSHDEQLSQVFDNFPSFSYRMFADMSNMSAASERSSQSEIAYLRECLEKERYRRKHCEQQIQTLNVKLLEVQQQLAVAISTDRRKDLMIDQLDKQLAKVVEGWKKREAEKEEYLRELSKEKQELAAALHKQQQVMESFQKEMAETVEKLKQEKDNSAALVDKLKSELSAAVHMQHHAEEMLAAEQERVGLMEREWEQLKDSRDLAEKRAQQAQEQLHQEQDGWYQSRQEFMDKIDQVKEANLKVMQMERVKLEEQTKKVEDVEERLHLAQTEVKKLQMELDSALREKESQKVEMALIEARHESSHRALEAELHVQMERKVSEEVQEVQERLRREMESHEEKHRQLVSDLHQQHQQDLEQQMAQMRHEASRKETDLREQLADMEDSLNDAKREVSMLKQAKQRLESQRIEVLSKLQVIMQSQWNEAVSLLVSTPQRKTLNTSLPSTLAGVNTASPSLGTEVITTSGNLTSPVFSAGVAHSLPGQLDSHHNQSRSSVGSPPLNNLSGLSSARSSPRRHQVPRPHTSTVPARQNGEQTLSVGDSELSLHNISTLLGKGTSNPPPGYGIHGFMRSGGLVVQARGERCVQSNVDIPGSSSVSAFTAQTFVHQPQPLPGTLELDTGAGLEGWHGAQAILVRPPLQLSSDPDLHTASSHPHPNHLHPHTNHLHDSSFLSASQISHLEPSSWSDGGGGGAGNRGGWRAVQGHTSGPGHDRGLALSDLDTGSRMKGGGLSLQSQELSTNGASLADQGHEGISGALHHMASSTPAYLPSMSPPVKQGRDGEGSVYGDVRDEKEQLSHSYLEISRQLEQHQSRQQELQHYIQMLLDKPLISDSNQLEIPGSNQPERDLTMDPDAMDISLSSLDFTLSEAVQASQISIDIQRLQELRDRQQDNTATDRHKSGSVAGNNSARLPQTRKAEVAHPISGNDTLPPEQLAEISRLLGQYSEDVEASHAASLQQADPATITHILAFLASLPHSQQQQVEGGQRSGITKNSPRQPEAVVDSRRTREPHRARRQPESGRHHSHVADTSQGSTGSASCEKDKFATSSTRSLSSSAKKSGDKKTASAVASASTSAVTTKPLSRPNSKDPHPVWK